MTITPDTKDWTWVLDEPCPECGFRAEDVPHQGTGRHVRAHIPRWQAALARPDAGTRPRAGVWSTTEYACHVRDVCDLFAERLALMLGVDDPLFANWDQDATAIEDHYAAQRASVVSDQLAEAFGAAATAFDAVPDDAWERRGRRSNGSVFTTRTLAQYFRHDLDHHLHDVDA